jgi:hypothetical protein
MDHAYPYWHCGIPVNTPAPSHKFHALLESICKHHQICTMNQGAGDHIDSVDLIFDLVEAKILNASDHIDVTRSITLVSHCCTRSGIWDSFFLSKNHELI